MASNQKARLKREYGHIMVTEGQLEGIRIIDPDIFSDARGYFFETYQKDRYGQNGIRDNFVQDNISFSIQGALRGLHYQHPNAQAKLVQVISGEVLDVVVDIRNGSQTFGQSSVYTLSDANKRQIYIPEGFAHGFCVLSETAVFAYKCSRYYDPTCERGILWSDPDLKIDWPVANPLLSDKDTSYPRLREVLPAYLPEYRRKGNFEC